MTRVWFIVCAQKDSVLTLYFKNRSMIKNDYKNRSSNQNIFSSSRRKSILPVRIMVITAIVLAVWGTIKSFNSENSIDASRDTSELGTLQLPTKTNSNIDNLQSPDTKNTTKNADAAKQELKLNFQHDESKTQQNDKNQRNKNAETIEAKKSSSLSSSSRANKEGNQYFWKKTKIRNGDSMARVFQRLKFSPTDLYKIISLGNSTKIFKKIKPGKFIKYATSGNGQLTAIKYPIDQLSTLIVTKSDDDWSANINKKIVDIRTASATGIINSSLFIAGKKAGLTDAMVMELAGIFGWDIDFILDIRKDDQFTVIYEEKYVNGEKIGNGNILAAEFINQNRSFKAVRYTSKSGRTEYFTPDGYSMRKAFLRAPVDFSYISSSFNPHRFHPILKRVKAHNGIDYRAPKGTPVKAAGDGKVIRSAYSKYNGHHVFIQHGQTFVTKYLHFTKRTVRRGQKVKQGQIIGYVGSTGLAEAPHLHYEFLVNGVHKNPRTVKLPDAKPIAKSERQSFLNKTQSLVKQLDTQSQVFSDNFFVAD